MGDDGGGQVLLEQRTGDARSGELVRRLSPDGTYAEYSGTATSLQDGQIVTEQVPPAWRTQEHLSAEQVARVEEALREGFFDLPAEYRPPATISDGYEVTWRACLDGKDHTVVLHSVDAGEVPGLAPVRDAFELALAEAAAQAGERSRES